MVSQISVVINTLNEEKNIQRAIESVSWADEIVVCDMHSTDKTVEIAKSQGAKVFYHKRTGFVEPARNFAIAKATFDWILILDADEEISEELALKLKEMVEKPISSDFVEMPRKNIIFGKWMQASMWWPDYQVRFFKKGNVFWLDTIHSKPQTKGLKLQLPAEEKWAIIHHNYQTISQFVERINRYTTVEAEQLRKEGYKFELGDLFEKPLNEFVSRFFANKGYLDGLHGLCLSFLQAISFLLVYLKIWEKESFEKADVSLLQIEEQKEKSIGVINYWFKQTKK